MASETKDEQVYSAPLSGTRAQALQRLQIGLFGLGAMVLLVGLANIVIERAEQTEAGTVPEAAATVAPNAGAPQASDPLADAGVAPEAAPEPTPAVQHQAQPVIPDVLPAQGD
jgi:hypothetical protein